MPEIRKDPVFGRWVIIASGRGSRPNDFRGFSAGTENPRKCPFCPGNEELTPAAIHTLPSRDGSGLWRLRVVLNKYPALIPDGDGDSRMDGIYDCMDGIGFHEVVIETPEHMSRLEDMSAEDIGDIFRIYALRINEIKKDRRIKYAMIFKNEGQNAGASLHHPHSQIIAMPMVPIRVVQEITGAENYMAAHSSCVFCDIVREEAAFKKRLVGENDGFIAIEPYASRFSFETWILPKTHSSHFEKSGGDLAPALSEIIKGTLNKLKTSLPGLAYNLIIHTMPVQEADAGHYHWHIEIMPKLNHVAGFEWGTGFYINTVSPENAAGILNAGKKFDPGKP